MSFCVYLSSNITLGKISCGNISHSKTNTVMVLTLNYLYSSWERNISNDVDFIDAAEIIYTKGNFEFIVVAQEGSY